MDMNAWCSKLDKKPHGLNDDTEFGNRGEAEMKSQWLAEPIGPGLWWFVPKDHEAMAAAREAPGWGDKPIYLAWVDNSTGGLTYEHVGGRGVPRALRSEVGLWMQADIEPPEPPKQE
jgi:hypothetical protein